MPSSNSEDSSFTVTFLSTKTWDSWRQLKYGSRPRFQNRRNNRTHQGDEYEPIVDEIFASLHFLGRHSIPRRDSDWRRYTHRCRFELQMELQREVLHIHPTNHGR